MDGTDRSGRVLVDTQFPLDGRPWRVAMGMRPLDLDEWLIRTDTAAFELAEKARLLSVAHDSVVATEPAGDAPSEELFELVHAFCTTNGWPVAEAHLDTTPHRIEAAARLVQEDLCILLKTSSGWRLSAACVCFPSRWSLHSKFGKELTEIHEPVPGYGEVLDAPTNRLFDRLTPDRPLWRLNWTLLETPVLHLPDPAARRERASGTDLAAWWLRVERQTLRVLPTTHAIVFTIATTVRPLVELLRDDDSRANALATALASAPEAARRYKGWETAADDLVAALRSTASGSS